MAIWGKYWCPEGCGKKVECRGKPKSRHNYICKLCKKVFTSKQLEVINTMVSKAKKNKITKFKYR
jgi:hypothetical protein